jgi:hypothetical protein
MAAAPSRAPAPAFAQRLLAVAATIWHNWATAERIKRSLIAYGL